ncbi:MAG: response regulator, partial [Fibrobacter sp.]|nr:response regulator [Fibrobacter sp.]
SQVIQNLLLNSIESMGRGGTITITLRNHNTSQNDHSTQRYIELIVSDTGSGIPEDILNRIYDPFFSTKPKGSGLGLATAHSVVKKHNGEISCESIIGKGTTFHILLPATSKKIPKPEIVEPTKINKSAGNILLLDDEEIIRTITEKLLSHLGYTVTTTVTGEETLKVYAENIKKQLHFDLVILDLTIAGGMGGKETMQKLLEMDPNVKALVSSGYSNDPIMSNFSEYGFSGIITKPYDVNELNKTIQSIINNGI